MPARPKEVQNILILPRFICLSQEVPKFSNPALLFLFRCSFNLSHRFNIPVDYNTTEPTEKPWEYGNKPVKTSKTGIGRSIEQIKLSSERADAAHFVEGMIRFTYSNV